MNLATKIGRDHFFEKKKNQKIDYTCIRSIICYWKSKMNVKFSKGHLSAPKPKSEDIEKSISRMKKW